MTTRSASLPFFATFACALALAFATTPLSATDLVAERWDKDVGKPAPELIPASWIGSPVSLSAVRGNTVVLAFWNADIPC